MSQYDNQRAALEAQVKALKDLIEVARAVVSTLDLDTVLQAILTSAMRFAEMPAGSIALYDRERNELSLHAHAGLTAGFVRKERWVLKAGGLTELVLKGGEIQFVEDTSQTEFFNNPIAVREGIKSLICMPLMLHKKIVGILYLDDFVPRQFDRERLELLSILASFAAMAIDNARVHNRTRLMAITDSLTGLHNRRYLQQILGQEQNRARRYKKTFSMLMMDVDDFKLFNDRYGHINGDRVLEMVGKIMVRTLRSMDYAFRYGGEEFIALLPETRLDNALLVAERLRAAIEKETVVMFDGSFSSGITVSIGVASYPRDADNQDELLNCIDSLLYKAKETGKNKIYSRSAEKE